MSKIQRPSSVTSDEYGLEEPKSPYAGLIGADRKRRRGVIEKRRRDRINCSLYDLKKLIPDVSRKPGSSKLEKAEILQSTVDFIHRLYSEGHVLSSEVRAVELRRAGFKECLLEVTRVLSTFEGSNVQCEELRRTLLTHLHQYDNQKDVEARAYIANVAAVANALEAQNPIATKSKQISRVHRNPEQLGCRNPWDIVPEHRQLSYPASQYDSLRNSYYPRHCLGQYPCFSVSQQDSRDGLPGQMNPTDAGVARLQNWSQHKTATSCHNELTSVRTAAFHNMNACDTKNCPSVNGSYSTVPLSGSQSYTGQPQAPNCSGPNESQSTSSPPFHSTPDDTETGSSPQALTRLLYFNDTQPEMNGKYPSRETSQIGQPPNDPSMLAHLNSIDLTPVKFPQYNPSSSGKESIRTCNLSAHTMENSNKQLPYVKGENITGTMFHTELAVEQPETLTGYPPYSKPYQPYGSQLSTATVTVSNAFLPSSSYNSAGKLQNWNQETTNTTDLGYSSSYWQYSLHSM
ncbi:Hairy/enhancer-of-split with YRPW motif protein 1 [Clonorchis sinensis]|uniref:Hairy/enhancer-of-split with YRPW motif protein 1 n=1 Tax=Clonorchis sinensis TaxID=79923 RepID=A0A419PNY9_CLOSI|nr:Hairy/enhancer-of-split with YRPW motif protein 1 [Clonorchis sinensis]